MLGGVPNWWKAKGMDSYAKRGDEQGPGRSHFVLMADVRENKKKDDNELSELLT